MTSNPLPTELSMVKCTPEFTAKYGEHLEPYRFVVKALRAKLIATLDYFEDCLANRTATRKPSRYHHGR